MFDDHSPFTAVDHERPRKSPALGNELINLSSAKWQIRVWMGGGGKLTHAGFAVMSWSLAQA